MQATILEVPHFTILVILQLVLHYEQLHFVRSTCSFTANDPVKEQIHNILTMVDQRNKYVTVLQIV